LTRIQKFDDALKKIPQRLDAIEKHLDATE
jgi:hypothetical protein